MSAPEKAKAPAVIHRKTALGLLSERLNVPAEELKNTLKATAFKECKTDAEFMAAVVVANEYGLNPFLKEIYAFPAKGGNVIPIVPIDGWISLVNRQERMDGVELIENESDNENAPGGLKSVTAKFFIKGRSNPVVVTEYMGECYDASKEPWKRWPRRMLRHKAYIQGARVAFGFSGIYDEDEGHRIIEAQAREVKDEIPAPKSLSGSGSRSEDRPADEKKQADVKPNPTINGGGSPALWSESLTTMRTALGDGEFFSILAWHNIHQPGDITDPKQEETVLAEMKASLSKKQ
jgi:phage recombination protein Bet